MTQTAEQLRNEASEHFKNEQESFDRCDTDGFVSQWASGINGRLAQAKAELIENGGVSSFPGLFDVESGKRVDAKRINGRYGVCWLLSDEAEKKYGSKFVPSDDSHIDDDEKAELKERGIKCSRSRKQSKMGLVQKWELRPAIAVIKGSGTGLSGAASCFVAVVPVEKRYDGLGS